MIEDDSHDDVEVEVGKKRPLSGSSINSARTPATSQSQPYQRGLMDKFITSDPQQVVRQRKKKLKLKESSISEAYNKEHADMVRQYIARWFYQASIPFNSLHLESFHIMIEAIGQFGPRLKPPSYNELRVPFLKKEYAYTKDMMKSHEDSLKKYGCSIILDGWTDRKDKTLLNFFVNTPRGTMFIESIDGSSYVKTGEKIYELLCRMVEKVGEENVVQVITDNGSNLVLAGRLLEEKYPHIYWTPCAAHCLDLILEDFGKIANVKRALQRAMVVNGFIYNHQFVLNMMREFTKQKELIRPAVTRFSTCFLTLQSIHKQKYNLRTMFNSEKWLSSRLAKEKKGRRVAAIVMMTSFWNDVVFVLKTTTPLVRLLRLLVGEKKPAMGYIYKAMDRAKEAIKRAFNDNESKYGVIFDIIDGRWDIQLHRPLHAAAYYLNPEFYYDNKFLESDEEVMKGLYHAICRLEFDTIIQDKIDRELSLYRNSEGLFGIDMAKRLRKTKSPVEWWMSFGSSAPNLQKLAISVLSLACSSSGCEQNWNIIEHIHSKKRNRLEQQRLNDLLYIKYNQALKDRWERRNIIDPISLKDIDESNEWLVGRMGDNSGNVEDGDDDFVYDDDELTWDMVARATKVEEPKKYMRLNSNQNTMPSSYQKKTFAPSSRLSLEDTEEVEVNLDESEEECMDGYESMEDDEEEDVNDVFDDELDD